MSWIENLESTFSRIEEEFQSNEAPLWPLSHVRKTAHIEVILDSSSKIRSNGIRTLEGEDAVTVIPATEHSANRSGKKIAPHPLCEELSYCCSDLPNSDPKKFDAYISTLRSWCNSEFSHPKILAILNYLEQKTLWRDLSGQLNFPLKLRSKSGQLQTISEHKAFLCWKVEVAGEADSGTWEDKELISKWIDYDRSHNSKTGFCYVKGNVTRIAISHPRFLRNAGDGAKIISSNDSHGFTYRGRFRHASQAAEVGFELSQKAHNSLRWLISKQNNFFGDQAFVAWATSGEEVANPLEIDLTDLNYDIEEPAEDTPVESKVDQSANLGQAYAEQLKLLMKGYQSKISHDATISVMMIGSATPTHGRMGIAYYRESLPETYYEELLRWHTEFAWFQRCKKDIPQSKGKPKSLVQWLPGSPSPYSMMNAVYGDILKGNDTLKKNFMERLIPSIIEGVQIPIDFVNCAFERARNRSGKKSWEWEKCLGVACALYRGSQIRNPDTSKRKEFKMALETDNTSRDYLYGRLLAIAERIEDTALRVSGINRPTAACRLMQRFSDRPYSTWLSICKQLVPYKHQLKNSRRGFLINMEKELDQVVDLFESETFMRNDKLTPEFLLGFHSERLHLHTKSKSSEPGETNTTEE